VDPIQRLAQERFGKAVPAGGEAGPAEEGGYVHTLLASPRGRDCVTFQQLGDDHVASPACPCAPNLVHCGDERVWLHQRLEDAGVVIGGDY